MTTVIASYRARPGHGDQVAALLTRQLAATRSEPGCVEFLALRSQRDPDEFTLYERYVDEDSFQAHRATPHFRRYIEGGVVPLLAERRWSRYDQLEPSPAGRDGDPEAIP